MLGISVDTDIAKAIAQLNSIAEAQQFRFAVAKALTQTAKDVQAENRSQMPTRFTIRRQWTVNQLRITPATKATLEAVVYHSAPFMSIQETGGNKLAKRRYIAIPTKLIKRTKTQVIAKSDRPEALRNKTVIIEQNGHKWIALKDDVRGRGQGKRLRLLYLLIPEAHLTKRLGLANDGMRVAKATFAQNLKDALAYAMRTAR